MIGGIKLIEGFDWEGGGGGFEAKVFLQGAWDICN